MRKAGAVLVELACGVVLAAVLVLGDKFLLASPLLVYLQMPAMALAGTVLGYWRSRAGAPGWLVVPLQSLVPAVLVLLFFGSRLYLIVVAVGAAGLLAGIAAARRRRTQPATSARSAMSARSARSAPAVGATVAAAAALLVLGALGPRFARSLVSSREVREAAAPFQLVTPTGQVVPASALSGHVAMIAFWATWCAPCQSELPKLDAFYQRHAADRRLAFYAVDVPMSDEPGQGDTPQRGAEFYRRRGFHMPLAFDAGGAVARALRVHGLPTLVVLDAAGQVRLRHVGYVGAEDLAGSLDALITKLLAETPVS